MKATIDETGFLVINAETPLEQYALRCWGNENIDKTPKNLIITGHCEEPCEKLQK